MSRSPLTIFLTNHRNQLFLFNFHEFGVILSKKSGCFSIRLWVVVQKYGTQYSSCNGRVELRHTFFCSTQQEVYFGKSNTAVDVNMFIDNRMSDIFENKENCLKNT